MSKRLLSVLLSVFLVLGVVVAPASAQTEIPAEVNIDDPFGDANTQSGDQGGPADASSVGDIGKIWFSHTAEEISVHFQTEAPPPATQGLVFQVYSNPNDEFPAPQGCLRFITIVPGSAPNYAGEQHVRLVDRCNDEGTSVYSNGVEGEAVIEELGDGTGLLTMTFPRSYSPLLVDGLSILEAHGRTDIPVGGSPPVGFGSLRLDDTALGTEYVLTGQEVKEKKKKTKPSPKAKPKPKPKKKKKSKKPKPPAAPKCPAYVPGEEGKDAELVVVTDAATEEKPIELDFDAPSGAGAAGPYDQTGSLFQNIQVDSKLPEAGLYVRYEFTANHDYDLYLNYADGSTAANSGDSQPVGGLGSGSPEGGWEAGSDFESVVGIRSADCTGYTARLVSFLTTGGATKLKLWLGEATVDPAAPGGGQEAFGLFYDLMGL